MMHTPDFLTAIKERAFEIFISNLPAAGALAVIAVMIMAAMMAIGNLP
jgi:hypothetical protein